MTQPSQAIVAEDEQEVLRQLRDWTNRLDRGCTLEQLAVAARQIARRIARLEEAADQDTGERAASDFRLMFVTLRRAAERAALAAQEQLRQIAQNHPAVPAIFQDGFSLPLRSAAQTALDRL